jgi:hypothetical protein
MNTYIVIQMQVVSKITTNNIEDIAMSNVVRKIEAETKEIAIGKFVLATQDIKANNKLNIECYDLTELKSV